MFGVIKFLLAIVAVVAFIWFGANVSLGSRTLFEHLQALGRTRASQDLVEGTRETTKPLVDDVRRRLGAAAAPAGRAVDVGAPPADEISQPDRQKLRKMLGTGHPAR